MKVMLILPANGLQRVLMFQMKTDGSAQLIAENSVNPVVAEIESIIKRFGGTFGQPDLVGFYTPFGGEAFGEIEEIDAGAMVKLEALVPRAPLHVPILLRALHAVEAAFPASRRILVCGSSFFANLPDGERHYAVDADLRNRLAIRRTGYNGLYHKAAADGVNEGRVLSICLEPRPEATAVLGGRPVMVTGGATPLEGLPGQSSCGEIDPGMVLILCQEHGLGPEEIAQMLTREGGLKGLAGRSTTISELFLDETPDLKLPREVLLYRLLQVTGSALAAMNGIDAIVFSGRHARAGKRIGEWLLQKLEQLPGRPKPIVKIMETPFEELLLDEVIGGTAVPV